MRSGIALVAFVACMGCAPNLSDGRFTCVTDPECPAGFACHGGLCSRGVFDGGARDGGTPCRLAPPQSGCATGLVCTIELDGTPGCELPGPAQEGDGCDAANDCVAGLACLDAAEGDTTTGLCSRLCSDDLGCSAGAGCALTLPDGAGGVVGSCTHVCDPVAQLGCPAGLRCFVGALGAGVFATDCAGPPGVGAQGSPCTTEADCRGGYWCAEQCVHWCNVGSGAGCAGGTTCRAYSPAIVVGATEYGACM